MGSRLMSACWMETAARALRFRGVGQGQAISLTRACLSTCRFCADANCSLLRQPEAVASKARCKTGNINKHTRVLFGPLARRHASNFARRWNGQVELQSWRVASELGYGGGKRRSSSSSSGTPSTKPESARGEAKMDNVSVEADAVSGKDGHRLPENNPSAIEEPRHSHIQMPVITDDEKFGAVTSWNVSVGDFVQAGDVVCEIELEQFSVGFKIETTGFVAEILVAAGSQQIPVGAHIATVVHSKDDIALYQEAREIREPAAKETEATTFSWKDVLKTVTRLSQKEKLSEDSASTLMALARGKDPDLLQAFDGCFEGTVYEGQIDDELFLVQARDIARTRRGEPANEEKDSIAPKAEEMETTPR